MIVITGIVVKMKRQESTMGFTQNMDDGNCICVRKSHHWAKDAERVDRHEGDSSPAQKSLFETSQHVV